MVPLSVNFHVPTNASKAFRTSPEKPIMTTRRRGADRMVITRQNTLTGAFAAHALDPEPVIIGEEIMTTHGEILAMYVSRVIPPGLSPEETIKRLRIKVHLLVSRIHLIPGEADLGSHSTYWKSSLWWMFWRLLTLVA